MTSMKKRADGGVAHVYRPPVTRAHTRWADLIEAHDESTRNRRGKVPRLRHQRRRARNSKSMPRLPTSSIKAGQGCAEGTVPELPMTPIITRNGLTRSFSQRSGFSSSEIARGKAMSFDADGGVVAMSARSARSAVSLPTSQRNRASKRSTGNSASPSMHHPVYQLTSAAAAMLAQTVQGRSAEVRSSIPPPVRTCSQGARACACACALGASTVPNLCSAGTRPINLLYSPGLTQPGLLQTKSASSAPRRCSTVQWHT